MHDRAVEALESALAAVGLSTVEAPRGAVPADVVVTAPDGRGFPIEVKAAALATAEQVARMQGWPREGVIPVLVAEQVPASARHALNASDVSWLDRRGRLRLTGPGLFVDAEVPTSTRSATSASSVGEPIAGRSGLAAAAALLMRPEDPLRVSGIARTAGLNPSSITRALASLAHADLAERRGRGSYRALVPELFWALADVWPRDRIAIHWAAEPTPALDGRVHPHSDPGDGAWVAGGVRAALEWGAPLVATADYPIELYLPDEQTIRRLVVQHKGGQGAEVRLTRDPTGFVSGHGYQVPSFAWPVAHPLFCALDLTATSRDREALEQWTPPEQFTRVW
jgi:hypothetical protein